MRHTLQEDWYFIVPATIIWLVALSVTAWDFLGRHKARMHFRPMNLMGAGAIVAGLAICLKARKMLGKHFTYALQTSEDHTLVRQGIYRYIRHPGYSGDLLFQFGVTLLFSSWRGLLLMLLLIPCFIYRIAIEERMLITRFGSDYREYVHSSKRLIPGLF